MARSMRSRFLWSTSAIVLVVVVVLGIGSAVLFASVVRREARARLDAQAAGLVVSISDRLVAGSDISLDELATIIPTDTGLILHLPNGRVVQSQDLPSAHTLRVVARGPVGSTLTLVTDARPIDRRIHDGWRLMALIGLSTVLGAVGLGAWQSRRLTTPLRRLEDAAAQLADDFSVRTPRSGISELDSLAEALDQSAQQIGSMVRSERQFSANASHQLRSPLTAMAMRLELISGSSDRAAADEAAAALDDLHALDQRIDGMLEFARTGRMPGRTEFDVVTAVYRHVGTIEPAFRNAQRTLKAVAPPSVMVAATPGAVGEVLEILLDNALRHGAGATTVSVEQVDGHVDLLVRDEGTFTGQPDSPAGHGVGLVLARNLLRPDGGTIELVSAAPTTFKVRLPAPS